jgi:hypothetical protein
MIELLPCAGMQHFTDLGHTDLFCLAICLELACDTVVSRPTMGLGPPSQQVHWQTLLSLPDPCKRLLMYRRNCDKDMYGSQ